jgi:hypothetical protein
MRQVATHFALGALTSGALAVLFSRLAGERVGSLVFLPVVVGVACASLAHWLGPWATPAILLLIAATMWRESGLG